MSLCPSQAQCWYHSARRQANDIRSDLSTDLSGDVHWNPFPPIKGGTALCNSSTARGYGGVVMWCIHGALLMIGGAHDVGCEQDGRCSMICINIQPPQSSYYYTRRRYPIQVLPFPCTELVLDGEERALEKLQHYGTKDIYERVVIASYYDTGTGGVQVWVTSDL